MEDQELSYSRPTGVLRRLLETYMAKVDSGVIDFSIEKTNKWSRDSGDGRHKYLYVIVAPTKFVDDLIADVVGAMIQVVGASTAPMVSRRNSILIKSSRRASLVKLERRSSKRLGDEQFYGVTRKASVEGTLAGFEGGPPNAVGVRKPSIKGIIDPEELNEKRPINVLAYRKKAKRNISTTSFSSFAGAMVEGGAMNLNDDGDANKDRQPSESLVFCVDVRLNQHAVDEVTWFGVYAMLNDRIEAWQTGPLKSLGGTLKFERRTVEEEGQVAVIRIEIPMGVLKVPIGQQAAHHPSEPTTTDDPADVVVDPAFHPPSISVPAAADPDSGDTLLPSTSIADDAAIRPIGQEEVGNNDRNRTTTGTPSPPSKPTPTTTTTTKGGDDDVCDDAPFHQDTWDTTSTPINRRDAGATKGVAASQQATLQKASGSTGTVSGTYRLLQPPVANEPAAAAAAASSPPSNRDNNNSSHLNNISPRSFSKQPRQPQQEDHSNPRRPSGGSSPRSTLLGIAMDFVSSIFNHKEDHSTPAADDPNSGTRRNAVPPHTSSSRLSPPAKSPRIAPEVGEDAPADAAEVVVVGSSPSSRAAALGNRTFSFRTIIGKAAKPTSSSSRASAIVAPHDLLLSQEQQTGSPKATNSSSFFGVGTSSPSPWMKSPSFRKSSVIVPLVNRIFRGASGDEEDDMVLLELARRQQATAGGRRLFVSSFLEGGGGMGMMNLGLGPGVVSDLQSAGVGAVSRSSAHVAAEEPLLPTTTVSGVTAAAAAETHSSYHNNHMSITRRGIDTIRAAITTGSQMISRSASRDGGMEELGDRNKEIDMFAARELLSDSSSIVMGPKDDTAAAAAHGGDEGGGIAGGGAIVKGVAPSPRSKMSSFASRTITITTGGKRKLRAPASDLESIGASSSVFYSDVPSSGVGGAGHDSVAGDHLKSTRTFLDEIRMRQQIIAKQSTLGNMRRFLVVDDCPVSLKFITQILLKQGQEVVTAMDGLHCLRTYDDNLAEGKHFNVILMDYQIPLLEGKEVVRELRARGFHEPIIGLTDDIHDVNRANAFIDSGADAVLPKPLNIAQLELELKQLAEHDEVMVDEEEENGNSYRHSPGGDINTSLGKF